MIKLSCAAARHAANVPKKRKLAPNKFPCETSYATWRENVEKVVSPPHIPTV